jgi:hypothetical protein
MSRLNPHSGAWKAAIEPWHRSHAVLKPVSWTGSAHPVCCAGRSKRSLIADASPVGGRTGITRLRKMPQTKKPASWRWLVPQRQRRRSTASWRSLMPRRRPLPGAPSGGGTLPFSAASRLRTAGELRWTGQRRGPGVMRLSPLTTSGWPKRAGVWSYSGNQSPACGTVGLVLQRPIHWTEPPLATIAVCS